jgi:hypothetical protein
MSRTLSALVVILAAGCTFPGPQLAYPVSTPSVQEDGPCLQVVSPSPSWSNGDTSLRLYKGGSLVGSNGESTFVGAVADDAEATTLLQRSHRDGKAAAVAAVVGLGLGIAGAALAGTGSDRAEIVGGTSMAVGLVAIGVAYVLGFRSESRWQHGIDGYNRRHGQCVATPVSH